MCCLDGIPNQIGLPDGGQSAGRRSTTSPPHYVDDFACNYLGDWPPAFETTVGEPGDSDAFNLKATVTTGMRAAAIVNLFGVS